MSSTASPAHSRAGIGADHHPVRFHEVLDRRALLQELRAGDVGEAGLLAHDRGAGPGGHRALHYQGVRVVVGQLVDHGANAGEVGVAGIRGWRVDAAEEQAGRIEHLGDVGGEGEPLAVFLEQLRETRLVHRHLAPAERLDLLGVHVESDHGVAELGKACGGNEADPADADHPDG